MFGYFGEVSDELRQGALNNVRIAIENFKNNSLKEAELRGKIDVLLLKWKNISSQWNSLMDKAYYQSVGILSGRSSDALDRAKQSINSFRVNPVLTNSIPSSVQDLSSLSSRNRGYNPDQLFSIMVGSWYHFPWTLKNALDLNKTEFLSNTTPGLELRQIYQDQDSDDIRGAIYDVYQSIKNDIGDFPNQIRTVIDQLVTLLASWYDVNNFRNQSKEALRQSIINAKELIADLPSIEEIENRIKENLDPITGQFLTPPPTPQPSPPVQVPDVVAIQEKPALVVAQEQPKSKLPAIAAAAAAAFYFLGGNK